MSEVDSIPDAPLDPPPSIAIECPVCHMTEIPLVRLRTLVICGNCGASLAVDGAGYRTAVHADIDDLSKDELAQLRRARASLARPERRQR